MAGPTALPLSLPEDRRDLRRDTLGAALELTVFRGVRAPPVLDHEALVAGRTGEQRRGEARRLTRPEHRLGTRHEGDLERGRSALAQHLREAGRVEPGALDRRGDRLGKKAS